MAHRKTARKRTPKPQRTKKPAGPPPQPPSPATEYDLSQAEFIAPSTAEPATADVPVVLEERWIGTMQGMERGRRLGREEERSAMQDAARDAARSFLELVGAGGTPAAPPQPEHDRRDPPAESPPRFIHTPADIMTLTVLAKAGHALKYKEIAWAAADMLRKLPKEQRGSGLVSLNETILRERVPLLLDAGFVARPLGPGGRSAARKGIGITDKGLHFLKSTKG
jgi:hypothetical protein